MFWWGWLVCSFPSQAEFCCYWCAPYPALLLILLFLVCYVWWALSVHHFWVCSLEKKLLKASGWWNFSGCFFVCFVAFVWLLLYLNVWKHFYSIIYLHNMLSAALPFFLKVCVFVHHETTHVPFQVNICKEQAPWEWIWFALILKLHIQPLFRGWHTL